jgi:hypothetical protein
MVSALGGKRTLDGSRVVFTPDHFVSPVANEWWSVVQTKFEPELVVPLVLLPVALIHDGDTGFEAT